MKKEMTTSLRFLLVLWIALLFNPARALNSKIYFFAYHNCVFKDPAETLADLTDKMGSKAVSIADRKGDVDIPARVAKKDLIPRVGDRLFLFNNSMFAGTEKVSRVYLMSPGTGAPYEVLFATGQKNDSEAPENGEMNNALEIYFDGPVDTQKLKDLNPQNEDLSKNGLTKNEVKVLESKMSKIPKNHPLGVGAANKKGLSDSEKNALDEKIRSGKWTPDLPPDWKENSELLGSLKLENSKVQVALFKAESNPPIFAVFQSPKGLFFFPIGAETAAHFDQIINWLGDYYLSVFEEDSGGYSKEVYRVTSGGLEKVGEINGTVGGEDMD